MDSKTISWVSYLTIIGWIIAYVSYTNSNSKQKLAAFHLRQSLGLVSCGLALYAGFWMLVFLVPILSFLISLIWIALVVLWVLGFIAALNAEEKPVPAVGEYFQQWFTFIK